MLLVLCVAGCVFGIKACDSRAMRARDCLISGLVGRFEAADALLMRGGERGNIGVMCTVQLFAVRRRGGVDGG